ncbi:hypothetical protein X738_22195 [Mesorhizobium sp. LNHC209A00]|nr:hypothetical protein X738_22195 [Mesorhizobium sp. LNHC209A00]
MSYMAAARAAVSELRVTIPLVSATSALAVKNGNDAVGLLLSE